MIWAIIFLDGDDIFFSCILMTDICGIIGGAYGFISLACKQHHLVLRAENWGFCNQSRNV